MKDETNSKEADVIAKVKDVVAKVANVEVEEISLHTDLLRDLHLDSLDQAEVTVMLEESLDITLPDSEYLSNQKLFPSITVADICSLVTRRQAEM